MNELTQYTFEGNEVRAVQIDGQPWFVGRDVAKVLGYSNPSKAISDHCRGVTKRYTLPTPSGHQEFTLIAEPDMYRLIVRSNMPNAVKFEEWVFETVLPSIRKTGSYSVQATPPMSQIDALLHAVQILSEHDKKIQRIEDNVTTISHRVDSLDTANIEGDLRQRFEKMINRYAWATGIKYPEAWKRFDQAYNTAFRTNLTALRQNYAAKHGMKSITRPEYFERVGQLPDAIRIADKMLASVKREGA